MAQEYLFVYGTLRRHRRNHNHEILAKLAEFKGEGTYQGKLYAIDYYPGVVPSSAPEDLVRGEVYRLKDPKAVFKLLDYYEGFGPEFYSPTEYVRTLEKVTLATGETLSAWIYLYNWSTENLSPIPGGDFLASRPA